MPSDRQVLQSLRMLLLLRGSCLQLVCRQAAAGLQELLRTAAGCVSSPADWAVLFTLLECVGAGARPPAVRAGHTAAEPGQSLLECGRRGRTHGRRARSVTAGVCGRRGRTHGRRARSVTRRINGVIV